MISTTKDRLAETFRNALCPYMQKRIFPGGQTLWSEGDTDGMLVSIRSGHDRIVRYMADARRVTMYIFGPETLFGFMPLLDNGPYPATAETITEVEAMVMSKQAFHAVVREHPDLCLHLLSALSRRLREAIDQIGLRSSHGVISKVAAGLSAQVPTEHIDDPHTVLTLPVSIGEYAALLGLTPESFSRAITSLEDMQVLHRLGHNRFQVLKPRLLKDLGTELMF